MLFLEEKDFKIFVTFIELLKSSFFVKAVSTQIINLHLANLKQKLLTRHVFFDEKQQKNAHCAKNKKCPYSELFWSIFSRIWTEYGEIWVSLRIKSECGKMWTRVTPNTDIFHAVCQEIIFRLKVTFFTLSSLHWSMMEHAPNFRDMEKIQVITNCQWNTLLVSDTTLGKNL